MNSLETATHALDDLETFLRTTPPGTLDPVTVAERVRAVRHLLTGDEAHWIGTTVAKRLMNVGSENTIRAWARLGLLRSRQLPHGRTQVHLDDVLRRHAENEALQAIDIADLSPAEFQMFNEERLGTNPWERKQDGQRE